MVFLFLCRSRTAGGEKIFIGIDNYLKLMKDEAFLASAQNSLILAVASIVGQLIPALFFTLVLARNVKGEKVYRTIYFIPVLLSTVVIRQLFLKIYNPDYGALNAILRSFGFKGEDWLGDKMFAITFINSEKYRTLTVGIMQIVGQYTTDWGTMGAGLVVATLPTVVICLLFSNQVQSDMVVGAVKG